MTYTPNPTDVTNPTINVVAGTAYQEFQALKLYQKQILQSGYRRNLLLNASMFIDQINNGNAYTVAAGTTVYTIDQWVVSVAGGSCSVARIAAGPVAQCASIQLVNASGVTALQLIQRIEALYTQPLVNGAVISVSGWVYTNNSAVTFTPQISTPASAVNTFSSVTTVATGTAVATTSGSFVYFSQQLTLSAGCSYGAQLSLAFSSMAGATIQLTQLQVEVNAFTSPFDLIPPQMDLIECQRYCYLFYANQTNYATAGSQTFYCVSPIFNTYTPVAGTAPTIINTGAGISYYNTSSNSVTPNILTAGPVLNTAPWIISIQMTSTSAGSVGCAGTIAAVSRL